jgi:hypothetical protein
LKAQKGRITAYDVIGVRSERRCEELVMSSSGSRQVGFEQESGSTISG